MAVKPRKIKKPSAGTPTNAILESILDGVFTIDTEWRVISFNWTA